MMEPVRVGSLTVPAVQFGSVEVFFEAGRPTHVKRHENFKLSEKETERPPENGVRKSW